MQNSVLAMSTYEISFQYTMVRSKHLCTQREQVRGQERPGLSQKPLVLQLRGWQQMLVMESRAPEDFSPAPQHLPPLSRLFPLAPAAFLRRGPALLIFNIFGSSLQIGSYHTASHSSPFQDLLRGLCRRLPGFSRTV